MQSAATAEKMPGSARFGGSGWIPDAAKDAATTGAKESPSSRDKIPLNWRRKWGEIPLADALAALDLVPMVCLRNPEALAAWPRVRERIVGADLACREIRRLASWLDYMFMRAALGVNAEIDQERSRLTRSGSARLELDVRFAGHSAPWYGRGGRSLRRREFQALDDTLHRHGESVSSLMLPLPDHARRDIEDGCRLGLREAETAAVHLQRRGK